MISFELNIRLIKLFSGHMQVKNELRPFEFDMSSYLKELGYGA